MTLFLSAVLAAAAFQSFCKLALLPRRWELLAAALAARVRLSLARSSPRKILASVVSTKRTPCSSPISPENSSVAAAYWWAAIQSGSLRRSKATLG